MKQNSDKTAREALDAWIKNHRLWCHDPKETGWQSEKETGKDDRQGA